jgi:hypothetical protein
MLYAESKAQVRSLTGDTSESVSLVDILDGFQLNFIVCIAAGSTAGCVASRLGLHYLH